MNILEHIKLLKNGQHYMVPESDYGKAYIHKLHDIFIVFEIPIYGGNPSFSFATTSAIEVVETIEAWT